MLSLLAITLDCGVTVSAVCFRQSETYEAGWAFGPPSAEKNQRRLDLDRKLEEHRSQCPVYQIIPETVVNCDEVSLLPAVTCVVHLTATDPVKDPKRHESHLAVIYYENAISPHISEPNLGHTREINWPNVADDFDY